MKPFIVHDVDQRSEEWRQLRAGLLTGSCAAPILATRKRGSGELQSRIDLRRRIVCERMTGIPADDTKQSEAMKHGVQFEPVAFSAYEARTGHVARRAGFLTHHTLATGCSLDGYVGDYVGVIELKCPASTTHLEYLLGGVVPPEYWPQCLHALWLTQAEWCDFCSFDARFTDPALQLFIRRIWRSEVQQDLVAYELAVSLFLSEVERDIEAVMAIARERRAA